MSIMLQDCIEHACDETGLHAEDGNRVRFLKENVLPIKSIDRGFDSSIVIDMHFQDNAFLKYGTINIQLMDKLTVLAPNCF